MQDFYKIKSKNELFLQFVTLALSDLEASPESKFYIIELANSVAPAAVDNSDQLASSLAAEFVDYAYHKFVKGDELLNKPMLSNHITMPDNV